MKILFIGGTGTISMAITRLLAKTDTVYVLNRRNRGSLLPKEVNQIKADISDEAEVKRLLQGMDFDVIVDFIAFVPSQVERDYRLFAGKCRQYIFISSASAYQKPPVNAWITESTPLHNPFWGYSRNKAACEEYLLKQYRDNGFPVTIVRPSHTYDERNIPVGAHGTKGSWQVIKRMLDEKPVIIHGDGTSLWTITHNSDFAKGFIGLLGNVHAIGEAFHITSDESLTWNQIYQSIADALSVELHAVHIASELLAKNGEFDFTGALLGDKANTVLFDNTKIKRLVPGFHAEVRFDCGIRKTIENVLASKELQTEDPEFDAWCDVMIEKHT